MQSVLQIESQIWKCFLAFDFEMFYDTNFCIQVIHPDTWLIYENFLINLLC